MVKLLRRMVIGVYAVEAGSGDAGKVSVGLLVQFVETKGPEGVLVGVLSLLLVGVASPLSGTAAPSVMVACDVVPVAGQDGQGGALGSYVFT